MIKKRFFAVTEAFFTWQKTFFEYKKEHIFQDSFMLYYYLNLNIYSMRSSWSKLRRFTSEFKGLNTEDAAFLKRVAEDHSVYVVEATFKEKDSYGRPWFYFEPVSPEGDHTKSTVFVDNSSIPFWSKSENYPEDSALTHPIKTSGDWSLLKVKPAASILPFVPEQRYKMMWSTSVYEAFKCATQTYTGWTVRVEVATKPGEPLITSTTETSKPSLSCVSPKPEKPSKAEKAPAKKPRAPTKRAAAPVEDKKPKKPKLVVESVFVEEPSTDAIPDSPPPSSLEIPLDTYDDQDNEEFEKSVRAYEERVSEEKRANRSKFGKLF
jgi:hypothetical protein